MEQVLNGTTNYLVPASGKTHSVTYSGLFSVTPLNVDWRQFSVDNYQFQPQGVFIDNILGITDLVITILPINYHVVCPAGVTGQFQFPAPDNQTCTITGSGQASVVFVDFPVLPNAGLINIGNTVNVQIAGPNPLPVSMPVNFGGAPYQTHEINNVGTPVIDSSITGAVVLASLVVPANSNLRLLVMNFSSDATLAIAGITTLTATLNGVLVYSQNIYLTAVAAAARSPNIDLDYPDFNLNSGAAGTLDIAISTALATGVLDINAYFTL